MAVCNASSFTCVISRSCASYKLYTHIAWPARIANRMIMVIIRMCFVFSCIVNSMKLQFLHQSEKDVFAPLFLTLAFWRQNCVRIERLQKSFSFIKASNLVVIIIKVTHINKNYEEIFNRIDLLRDNLYRYECEF